jgi:hypothetical protein
MKPYALSPPPASMPPPSLNHQKLYDRELSSKALFYALHNTLGTRITPICDDCFGAGKTSLIWKFRTILNEWQEWEWPAGSQHLRDAIYIQVKLSPSDSRSYPLDLEDPFAIDRMLLERFTQVFSLSLRNFSDIPAAISFDELILKVTLRCGSSKLLVHIDSVGAYEHYKYSKNILYHIWSIGDRFRSFGHYHVLTGRSSYLYTIGCSSVEITSRSSYGSPNFGIFIPLPLLTILSIKLMFQEQSASLSRDLFNENNEPRDDIIHHIHSFTSGVPRAVHAAILCYTSTHSIGTYHHHHHPTFIDVEDFIDCKCAAPTLLDEYWPLFHCCLELSWAQISLTNEETILNQPITAVIARLGIFRNYNNEDMESFILTVPLYLMRLYNWPYLSIMSFDVLVSEDDKGPSQLLVSGLRRILLLRLSMGATNWTGLGLPILDSMVPFPETKHERSYYPFPQLVKKCERTEAEARQCMHEIHHGQTTSPSSLSHTSYSSECLPWLYDEMEIGQYYQPLVGSTSSADAFIRCSERNIIYFQFKNFQSPFPESSLEEEIVKCSVNGWSVCLVIVCSEGHSITSDDRRDYLVTRDGVDVVVLAKNSVAGFCGAAALQFSSSNLSQDLWRKIHHSR